MYLHLPIHSYALACNSSFFYPQINILWSIYYIKPLFCARHYGWRCYEYRNKVLTYLLSRQMDEEVIFINVTNVKPRQIKCILPVWNLCPNTTYTVKDNHRDALARGISGARKNVTPSISLRKAYLIVVIKVCVAATYF